MPAWWWAGRRRRALEWLGQHLGGALRAPGGMRGHWFDLAHGAAAVLWIVVMSNEFYAL